MTKKHAYITTAIPYANGEPHVGHALDYLLADVWSRYQRQFGREVRFQAGVDEHGNKISAAAKQNNLDPQSYVNQMHLRFKELLTTLNITATDFIRTSDPIHVTAVQFIWKKLVEADLIYKGSYEGWYCEGCEAFVADKEASDSNGICPDHQVPYQRLSEENYYFKTSLFSERIKEAIESGKMKIIPKSRENEFLELIKDGLQDVSFSRPKKDLSWGIPVPDDESQVMYVWPDALSNYITVLGYPGNSEWQNYWPADISVIGKDILRFHAGIWPAMLMALELPLPKVLLVHGHVTSNGAKMSKSLNNGVAPGDILPSYGLDAFRYYFLRYIPTQDDGDFTWERFEAAYNGELSNDLGNLVQRVAKMVLGYQAGVIGDARQSEHDMGTYRMAMDKLEFNRALDEAWEVVRSLNRYIDHVEPWQVAKRRDTDTEAESHLAEILAHASGVLLQISDMLEPFLPDTSTEIKRLFASGVVPSDVKPLFPKIYLHSTDPRTPTS